MLEFERDVNNYKISLIIEEKKVRIGKRTFEFENKY